MPFDPAFDKTDVTLRRWAEELRSGRHIQNRGEFGSIFGSAPRCAVGVLLRMLVADANLLTMKDAVGEIAKANDAGDDFEQIANLIELYADTRVS